MTELTNNEKNRLRLLIAELNTICVNYKIDHALIYIHADWVPYHEYITGLNIDDIKIREHIAELVNYTMMREPDLNMAFYKGTKK